MKYLSSYFRRLYACLLLMGLFAVIARFSEAVDVPADTGASIFFRAAVIFAICFVLLLLQFLPFSYLFPILLGGFAWAFFPALDYWSAEKITRSLFGIAISDAEWYIRWYSKTGFVLIPIFIGHAICYWWKKQNKTPQRVVEW